MPLMQNPLSKRCHFCFSFVVTVLLTIGILDIMAGAIWFLLALAAGRTQEGIACYPAIQQANSPQAGGKTWQEEQQTEHSIQLGDLTSTILEKSGR